MPPMLGLHSHMTLMYLLTHRTYKYLLMVISDPHLVFASRTYMCPLSPQFTLPLTLSCSSLLTLVSCSTHLGSRLCFATGEILYIAQYPQPPLEGGLTLAMWLPHACAATPQVGNQAGGHVPLCHANSLPPLPLHLHTPDWAVWKQCSPTPSSHLQNSCLPPPPSLPL